MAGVAEDVRPGWAKRESTAIGPGYRRGLVIALGLTLVALAYSLVEMDRYGPESVDGRVYYVAGELWLEGESAYDRTGFVDAFRSFIEENGLGDQVERAVFVNLPVAGLVAVPLSVLPWDAALWILVIANLGAWTSIGALGVAIAEKLVPGSSRRPAIWIAAALSGFVGSVSYTVAIGQVGLLAMAGAMLLVFSWMTGRRALAAVGAVLALLKLQVTLPVLAFVAGAGMTVPLVWAGAATVVLWVALEASAGLGGSLDRFRTSLDAYQDYPFNGSLANRPGLYSLFGDGQLADALVPATVVAGTLFGAHLGWRWRTRRREAAHHATGRRLTSTVVLLLAVAPVLSHVHRYDLLTVVAVVCLFPLLEERTARPPLIAAFVLMLRPHSVAERLDEWTPDAIDWMQGRYLSLITLAFVALVLVALELERRADRGGLGST